jgi:hypothetical protein
MALIGRLTVVHIVCTPTRKRHPALHCRHLIRTTRPRPRLFHQCSKSSLHPIRFDREAISSALRIPGFVAETRPWRSRCIPTTHIAPTVSVDRRTACVVQSGDAQCTLRLCRVNPHVTQSRFANSFQLGAPLEIEGCRKGSECPSTAVVVAGRPRVCGAMPNGAASAGG